MNAGRLLSNRTTSIMDKQVPQVPLGTRAGMLRIWPAPPPQRCRQIPPKLYRIGEIVEYTGLSRQTVHNYTIMGLITEARRSAGGHRLYEESVFERLDAIEELKRQRKTMREIRGHFAGIEDQINKGSKTDG